MQFLHVNNVFKRILVVILYLTTIFIVHMIKIILPHFFHSIVEHIIFAFVWKEYDMSLSTLNIIMLTMFCTFLACIAHRVNINIHCGRAVFTWTQLFFGVVSIIFRWSGIFYFLGMCFCIVHIAFLYVKIFFFFGQIKIILPFVCINSVKKQLCWDLIKCCHLNLLCRRKCFGRWAFLGPNHICL